MVVAIIQARLGSSRLPGKVLAEVEGRPLLERVVCRAARSARIDRIIVATTTEQVDDPIAAVCGALGIGVFRGSEPDVLDRYHLAATWAGAQTIVRITADCPLIDPAVIDRVVECYQGADCDYVSNIEPPTFPDGLDVEVFSRSALERTWREATSRPHREHVTLYIRESPGKFRLANVTHHEDLSQLRWVVDEPPDLDLVREVYRELGEAPFGLEEVLSLLRRRPALAQINQGIGRNEGLLTMRRDEVAGGTGPTLYTRAKQLIPGGTQLLSKRPEMFLPDRWPSYYSKASGAEVWDLDGHRYLDMSYAGLGACVLGYADPDVDAAVGQAIRQGTMSTLNCPEEVELAELLVELHPWADMVRYTRSGGEAMAVAVRIARAASGRDKVAFCGYHGWHDWYLAANLAGDTCLDGHLLPGLAPRGVPRGLQASVLPFEFNRLEQLEDIARDHDGELGAIVLEPARQEEPAPGFLAGVRRIARRAGAVLVFDEITAGFRLTTGGAHLKYGVNPDIAVFAKGLGNGYPIAAVLGIREVMEAAQTTFMSSTFWTERIGPVAALATIRKHRSEQAGERLQATGRVIQVAWRQAADRHGLSVHVGGIAPLAHLGFGGDEAQATRTLYTQLMLERDILASSGFYAMLAHRDHQVERYVAALDEVFAALADHTRTGGVRRHLKGPVAHSGFRRLA
jgi:glutamate-1-semialdehyde 2,1-aminomutase